MGYEEFSVVVDACVNSEDPLELQVLREEGAVLDEKHDTYSKHSACPYYLSRALSKHAEIVFAPYNYLLDPGIRDGMGIDVSKAVVVLDEAHNVEDSLRESGSGSFGEFELCELMIMLQIRSRGEKRRTRNGEGEEDVRVLAHELLLFVEKLVLFMRESRIKFENSFGTSGAQGAINEWQRFHNIPDDKEFEIEYFGPTGYGVKRKAVGCKLFFDRLRQFGFIDNDILLRYAKELENEIVGNEAGRMETNLCDRLIELVSKLTYAMTSPEHFYISCAARANGSLSFASGKDESDENPRRRTNAPKKYPLAYPRTVKSPRIPVLRCNHERCAGSGTFYHCGFCDGSTPRWEAVLNLELLTPSVLFAPIANDCRSIVLASGSLAPLGSLCAELGLSPASDEAHSLKSTSAPVELTKSVGKLQVKPPSLEANHVVDIEKQLRAISIGSFPDGSPLTATYANYRKEGTYTERVFDCIFCLDLLCSDDLSLSLKTSMVGSGTHLRLSSKLFRVVESFASSRATLFCVAASRRGSPCSATILKVVT
jgi:Rad3-related DNA helicase